VDNKEFSKEANTDYEECSELLAIFILYWNKVSH